MTDENRVYVGDDAYGNALYVGDVVQLIDHPMIDERAVGKARTIRSATLRYPVPAQLLEVFGESGWFEVVTKDGKPLGLHGSAVWKKETA